RRPADLIPRMSPLSARPAAGCVVTWGARAGATARAGEAAGDGGRMFWALGADLFDLDDLPHRLAVLLDRLVVGLAELHVLAVAHRDLLAPLGEVLDERSRGRRRDGVAACRFVVVGPAVIVRVGRRVHDDGA